MSDNLLKKPAKGILKNSSSFDTQDNSQPHRKSSKETKWDEMNIIATLHPPDKDYGHMKIEEPKTPYNYDFPEAHELDAADLAEKLKNDRPAKVLEESDSDEEVEEELSPEEQALRKDFESKRKAHYNEYYAVKLARKLLEEEDDDEDEEEIRNVAGSSSQS